MKFKLKKTTNDSFKSQNMNYIYYHEYFEGLEPVDESRSNNTQNRSDSSSDALHRTDQLCAFEFVPYDFTEDLKGLEGYKDFMLFTQYPGLLIGTGNEHNLALDGGVKCGFAFDSVTGLPYISGSSLKGMLRSCFGKKNTPNREEHQKYIRAILQKEQLNVENLEQDIFDNHDIFIGAYPVMDKNEVLLDKEYVTPTTPDFYSGYHDRPAHSKGELQKFKNPVPINFIKVKPNIKFKFVFILHDSNLDGVVISAEEKLKLFQSLILDNGIGAKTNTGYGRFSCNAPEHQKRTERCKAQTSTKKQNTSQGRKQDRKKNPEMVQDDIPICSYEGCTNKVKFNVSTNSFGRYCEHCLKIIRAERKAKK